MPPAKALVRQWIDIGANLLDPMFQGIYNADLANVIERARRMGMQRLILTAGTLEDTVEAIKLCNLPEYNGFLYTTLGVHPTNSRMLQEHSPSSSSYLDQMKSLLTSPESSAIIAIGEFGLDYERLEFATKEVQRTFFEQQLDLFGASANLPLFLHCRAAHDDLYDILKSRQHLLGGKGVIHSFDGTFEQAEKFMALGYFIGLNGCSMRTPENILTIKQLPLNKILLETDAPWCSIRPTHESHKYLSCEALSLKKQISKEKYDVHISMSSAVSCSLVKGRNEPATIEDVAQVVAAVKGLSLDDVMTNVLDNSLKLFFAFDR